MSELKQLKASAGSGKTYQLTRRFLALLDAAGTDQHGLSCARHRAKGYSWPEILAATFTNKAASEMKERVVSTLKSGALGQGERATATGHNPRKDEQALQSILRRYHRLNIRTIDSLLNMLMRLFALDFGIRPDFEIALNEQELFDGAYDLFLSHCETDGIEKDQLENAIRTLLVTESRKGFWVMASIRNRLMELMIFLRDQHIPINTDQEKLLTLLTKANARMKEPVDGLLRHIKAEKLPAKAHFLTALHTLESLDLFSMPKSESTYLAKDSLCDCINTKGKDKVDGKGEALYSTLKTSWAQYKEESTLLRGAYNLAPAVVIAYKILELLERIEKQKGIIPNSALPGHVNRLLDTNMVPEAFCRLGGRLHHLLIDEFQDTSRPQWKAMQPLAEECLAKGGSLFYVGDVKQAIYSWRGGDADLFDQLPGIAALADCTNTIQKETLPNNWRSHRHIVEFNNTFFANFEGQKSSLGLVGSLLPDAPADFLDSFASQLRSDFQNSTQGVAPAHKQTTGYVRFERVPGENKEAIEEATLESLKAVMEEILCRRPCSDVAILVRSAAHGSLVCDVLVDMGIAVITESSLRLDLHPIIRQATALLEFIDYPRNELALAEFLLGEELFRAESGLTADTLHTWLLRPDKRSLDTRLAQDFPHAWDVCIKPFYNKAGVMTPYDLMQDISKAYHIAERHPEALLYLNRFLEVIHLAEENGYGSLSTFLDFWRANSETEKVPLPDNVDAVRIMTIHKSKGLEFPVVVVPFHHWEVQQDTPYFIQTYQNIRMLAPLTKALGKPFYTSIARSMREQLNLLYVAWTRAREELYGFYPEEMKGVRAALRSMEHFFEPDSRGVTEYGTPPQADSPPPPREAVQLPSPMAPRTTPPELMSWLPRLRVYRHTLEESLYSERLRGEVAHRAMEHLRIMDNADEAAQRALTMALHDFPELASFTQEIQKNLEDDILLMLHWALGHDQLRMWLSKGISEPEIMDEKGAFHRVDHLYKDKTSAMVVEFKTGQEYPEHPTQVRRYMELLAAMPNAPQSLGGVLVYLDLRLVKAVEQQTTATGEEL